MGWHIAVARLRRLLPVLFSGTVTEMRARYAKLFASSPSLRCRLVSRVVRGSTVIDQELVTGMAGRATTRAVAVYRVEGGRITHVWFHSVE